MNYENDIFDYLGIVGREDSYTNLIKVLFDSVPEYKIKLLEILFGRSNLNSDDFYLETRRKYGHKSNNIIPDIIIVDTTGLYFALIEVKVFSDEGDKQTSRYYNMFSKSDVEIYYAKGNVCLNEYTDRKFYYLTIYDAEPKDINFKNIKWKNIVEPLRYITIENEYLSVLVKSLLNKVNSAEINDNCSIDMLWSELMGYGWANEERMFRTLQQYCFKEDVWKEVQKWNGYNKDSNAYELKCSFGKERWIGKNLKEFINENSLALKSCYMFHYELAYNPATNNLTIRLDYHLNPYLSEKDIKNKRYNFFDLNEEQTDYLIEISNEANKGLRKKIATSIKNDFPNDLIKRFSKKVITPLRNNPMTLAKIKDFSTENKSIKEVAEVINEFVRYTEKSIDYFIENI